MKSDNNFGIANRHLTSVQFRPCAPGWLFHRWAYQQNCVMMRKYIEVEPTPKKKKAGVEFAEICIESAVYFQQDGAVEFRVNFCRTECEGVSGSFLDFYMDKYLTPAKEEIRQWLNNWIPGLQSLTTTVASP